MENAENIKQMYSKLAKAKKEFLPIVKNIQGYGYKYANLNESINSIKDALLDNQLDFRQRIKDNKLITELIDFETGYIEELIIVDIIQPVMNKTNELQQLGAGITYLRRYSLLTGLGLATEDDDAQDFTANNKNNVVHDDPKLTALKIDIRNLLATHEFEDKIKNLALERIENKSSTVKTLQVCYDHLSKLINDKKLINVSHET
jgi:ERF superfamily